MFVSRKKQGLSGIDYLFIFLYRSSENYKEFQRWQQHDDAQDNFCVTETSPGEYVDLLLNPERYTGYKGPSAHRIWRSIYMENCFRPEKSPHNFIQSSKVNGKFKCLLSYTFGHSLIHSYIHLFINKMGMRKW